MRQICGRNSKLFATPSITVCYRAWSYETIFVSQFPTVFYSQFGVTCLESTSQEDRFFKVFNRTLCNRYGQMPRVVQNFLVRRQTIPTTESTVQHDHAQKRSCFEKLWRHFALNALIPQGLLVWNISPRMPRELLREMREIEKWNRCETRNSGCSSIRDGEWHTKKLDICTETCLWSGESLLKVKRKSISLSLPKRLGIALIDD